MWQGLHFQDEVRRRFQMLAIPRSRTQPQPGRVPVASYEYSKVAAVVGWARRTEIRPRWRWRNRRKVESMKREWIIERGRDKVQLVCPVCQDFNIATLTVVNAQVMDKLGQAEWIIADIRISANRLLEALFVAVEQPHQGIKPLQVFLKEDACMR